MSISICCPHCKVRFRADERIAGREVGCPKCNGKFVIPKVAPSQPPPLPPTATQVATKTAQPNPLGFLESTPPPPPNRSNVAPKSKDSRRAWQALAVGVAIGVVWIVVDEKSLPTNNHPNQTTASVNPPSAPTTSDTSSEEKSDDISIRKGDPIALDPSYRDGHATGLQLGYGYVQRMKLGDPSAFSDAKLLYQERIRICLRIGDKNNSVFKSQLGIADGIKESLANFGANVFALDEGL